MEPSTGGPGAVRSSAQTNASAGASGRMSPLVGGAYTTYEEDKKDRIVARQWADFVVLDRDPTTIEPESLPETRTMMTIVGGRMVYTR